MLSKIIKKGVIFIPLLLGSLGLVGANLFFAKVLSEKEFGLLSLYLTIISFVTSFGLLGIEQPLIRIIIGNRNNEMPIRLLMKYSALGVVIPLMIAIVSRNIYQINEPWLIISLLFLCVSISLGNLFSTILRSQFRFLISQIVIQFWKLLFFSFGFLLFINHITPRVENIILVLVCACLIGLLGGFKIKVSKKNESKEKDNQHLKFVFKEGIMFAGIIASISFMNTLDRLLIPKLFGYDIFANYTVSWSVLCYPFILVQTGIGFILMPHFRASYINNTLGNEFKRIKNLLPLFLIGIIIFTIGLFLCSDYIIHFFFENKFAVPRSMKFILIILGLVKLYYGFISSLFGAVAKMADLVKANLIGLLCLFLFIIFAIIFKASLFSIIALMSSVWILRSLLYTYITFHSLSINPSPVSIQYAVEQ